MTRTILCFGDSNTHGTRPMPSLDGAGRFGHEARWPSVQAFAAALKRHLEQRNATGLQMSLS
jgi:lysophospholipase L1-like esterase